MTVPVVSFAGSLLEDSAIKHGKIKSFRSRKRIYDLSFIQAWSDRVWNQGEKESS
jgi:hypothetical protein